MPNIVSDKEMRTVGQCLDALGHPRDIIGKVCHITAEDRDKRSQTFANVKIIGCYLRQNRNCQELVIKIGPQTHRRASFDTITRNVGAKAGGVTNWWTIVTYATEAPKRTESWKITGLMISK